MDATLGLALDMQRMSASLLPSNGSATSPTSCSHAGHLVYPAPVALEPSSSHSPVAASSLRPLDPSQDAQLPTQIEERLRGLLGEPLSTVDRSNVQLEPLRSCLPGEIVAVSDSGGLLRYGKAVQEEDPSGEVKVQVSKSCIRWYAVSQIYFFQSVKEVWTSKSDKTTDSDTSAVSVIAAVNALLGRLNVSLSTSYEELLAETLRLQHRATLAEEDRRDALKEIELAVRAKRDAEKALVCVVCLVNAVDRVLIPCGHSYCQTCVERLHRGACPVCRQKIADSAVFRIS